MGKFDSLYFIRRMARLKEKDKWSPGIEPGTFCVGVRCDNHYTMELGESWSSKNRDNIYFYHCILRVNMTK